jgi:hypothetical protein
MFMIVLLALLDIFCGAVLLATAYGLPFGPVQAGLALLLLIKAVVFRGSFLSILDAVVAIAMILLLWISAPSIAIVLAIYLAAKGLYSLT